MGVNENQMRPTLASAALVRESSSTGKRYCNECSNRIYRTTGRNPHLCGICEAWYEEIFGTAGAGASEQDDNIQKPPHAICD